MRQVPSHAVAGLAGALLIAALARPAASDTPSPLASSLFAFPGATGHPASAVSAGLAMADRWLGDDPFENPAAAPGPGVALSGALLHVSRQDLRALNRNFDETPAFFDGAGLAGGPRSPGMTGHQGNRLGVSDVFLHFELAVLGRLRLVWHLGSPVR